MSSIEEFGLYITPSSKPQLDKTQKLKTVTQNSIMLSLMTKNISGVEKNFNTLNILCQTLKGKQNTLKKNFVVY